MRYERRSKGTAVVKNSILIIFLAICLITTYFGVARSLIYTVDQKEIGYVKLKSESFFSDFTLFLSNSRGPVVSVKGVEMVINHDGNNIFFFEPFGKLKRKGQESFFKYSASGGSFIGGQNTVILKDRVHFFDNDFDIKGERLSYSFAQEIVKGDGKVSVLFKHQKTGDFLKIHSDRFQGDMINKRYKFSKHVVGTVKRRRRFEDSLSFSAEYMQVDENKSLMTLDKDVLFKQRAIEARANAGHIFLENYNKKLKYYSLNDDVRVKERIRLGGGKFLLRKAFAEQLEGQMRQQKIVLSGFPKVIQSGSILTGNKIVLQESKKVIEIHDANSNFRVGN